LKVSGLFSEVMSRFGGKFCFLMGEKIPSLRGKVAGT